MVSSSEKIVCPHCNATQKESATVSGKKVTCRKCKKGFTVPSQNKDASSPGTAADQRQREGQEKRDGSWLDCRSKMVNVREERRRFPRIELHFPVRVYGSKTIASATDFSLGGVFIESEDVSAFEEGQGLDVLMNLPSEKKPVRVQAKVANVRDRGIGIEFVDVTQANREIIKLCFHTFKDTMPLKVGFQYVHDTA